MTSDVGTHHAKNHGNKKSSYSKLKDTSTIPSLHIQTKGYIHMIVILSLIYSIAKKASCSMVNSHGASLHQHSFSRMIFTLAYMYTIIYYVYI